MRNFTIEGPIILLDVLTVPHCSKRRISKATSGTCTLDFHMDQEQEWYPCLENVFLDGSTRLFGLNYRESLDSAAVGYRGHQRGFISVSLRAAWK